MSDLCLLRSPYLFSVAEIWGHVLVTVQKRGVIRFFTYPGTTSFFHFETVRRRRAALGMVSIDPSRRANSLALFFVPFILKGQERCKRKIRNRMVYNDWGLYGFVQMLAYKCLHVGKELHIISERDTTKQCHVCKHKQYMPLWVRTYRCQNCGMVMDRDENSAVNIYQRFLAGPPPHMSAI